MKKANRDKILDLIGYLRDPKMARDHAWTYRDFGGPGYVRLCSGFVSRGVDCLTESDPADPLTAHCGSAGCAIGLWNSRRPNAEVPSLPGINDYGVSYRDIIFFGFEFNGDRSPTAVQPRDVANALSEFVRTGRASLIKHV